MKGGMPVAKRSKSDMEYDLGAKADDHPFIQGVLNIVPKSNMKEFLAAMTPQRRSHLYDSIMPQKNGERILKAFIHEMGFNQQLEDRKTN